MGCSIADFGLSMAGLGLSMGGLGLFMPGSGLSIGGQRTAVGGQRLSNLRGKGIELVLRYLENFFWFNFWKIVALERDCYSKIKKSLQPLFSVI